MQKLKITDIAIGDWVMVKGKAVKVESLGKIRDYVELEGSLALCHIKVVQPIPITPEILEKNGFEICEGDWIGHDYRCIVQQHGGYWDVLSSKRGYYRTIRIDGLECVHELQHAIRLAGIEKEIEL